MAVHSKSMRVYANGIDLSVVLDSIDLSTISETADKTTFADTYKQFDASYPDGEVSASGFFEGAAAGADEILSAALGGNVKLLAYPAGDAVAAAGRSCNAVESSYNVMGTVDGMARCAMSLKPISGVRRCLSLHPMQVRTTDATGTSVDLGAAKTNVQVALQVLEATGATVVTIEHSTNNSTWADLQAFVSVSAQSAQVISVASCNRYVRAKWDVTTSAKFNAAIVL
jgi:hypothetical protein